MTIIDEKIKRDAYGSLTKTTTFVSPPTGGNDQDPDVEVITMKGKKKIYSVFQWGTYSEAGQFKSFSFMMFQSKSGRILETPCARVTEERVLEEHAKAVAAFMEMMKWQVSP